MNGKIEGLFESEKPREYSRKTRGPEYDLFHVTPVIAAGSVIIYFVFFSI